jgi:hypothetical protein
MRATDADRDSVHSVLQNAYADGRLSWEEFDSRSTALMEARTYDQLHALTVDLRQPVAYQAPYPVALTSARPTNQMAVASLICGICQIFFWFLAGIPAIVCGHVARQQIKHTGEEGSGMALAGLILGYIGTLGPLLIALLIILAVSGGHSG